MRDNVHLETAVFRALLTDLRPHIATNAVLMFNDILRRAPCAELSLNDKTMRLKLAIASLTDDDTPYRAAIFTKGKTLDVRFGLDLVAGIFRNQVVFDTADDSLVNLLVRHALGTYLTALSERYGEPTRIEVAPATESRSAVFLALHARLGDDPTSHRILIGGDFDLVADLLTFCDRDPDTGPSLTVRLDAQIASRPAFIATDQACNLAKGDLLFLAEWSVGDLLFLNVGGTPVASVQLKNGTASIGKLMTKDDTDQKNERTAPAPSLDTQVSTSQANLTIEVGRCQLSLGQVQELREGMLLDFGTIDTQAVSLRINGERAAYGTLLSIGDGVGLQIETIC